MICCTKSTSGKTLFYVSSVCVTMLMIFAGNVTNDKFDSFYIVKAQYTGQKGGVLMRIQREEKRFIEKCYRLYEQKMYQVAYSILRDSGLAEDACRRRF